MRPLSQVDPWNGCEVCRRQAELGIMPCHNWTHELRMWWNDKVQAWTHELRMWWNDKVQAWTHGTDPKHEPPEPSAIGTSSTAIGLTGTALALAPLADELRKGSEDETRLGPLESYYYAGCLAALLAGKYRSSTVKEAADAR